MLGLVGFRSVRQRFSSDQRSRLVAFISLSLFFRFVNHGHQFTSGLPVITVIVRHAFEMEVYKLKRDKTYLFEEVYICAVNVVQNWSNTNLALRALVVIIITMAHRSKVVESKFWTHLKSYRFHQRIFKIFLTNSNLGKLSLWNCQL